jgi:predicted ester cyclase
MTSTSDGKTLVAGYAKAVDEGPVDMLDEVIAEGFVDHVGRRIRDLAELKRNVSAVHASFSKYHFTIEELVAEEDKVAFRWRSEGKHTGEFKSVAPSGRHATWTGTTIVHVRNGRIAEAWTNPDTLGLLQQIGGIPKLAAT